MERKYSEAECKRIVNYLDREHKAGAGEAREQPPVASCEAQHTFSCSHFRAPTRHFRVMNAHSMVPADVSSMHGGGLASRAWTRSPQTRRGWRSTHWRPSY